MFATALMRAQEPRGVMQVLAGPRQVGKTTVARQVIEELDLPSHFASADDPAGQDREWIRQQWEVGRLLARETPKRGALLVLDEVQKVEGWASLVKFLWDEDTFAGVNLRVFLLGSAPLLVQRSAKSAMATTTIRKINATFSTLRCVRTASISAVASPTSPAPIAIPTMGTAATPKAKAIGTSRNSSRDPMP